MSRVAAGSGAGGCPGAPQGISACSREYPGFHACDQATSVSVQPCFSRPNRICVSHVLWHSAFRHSVHKQLA